MSLSALDSTSCDSRHDCKPWQSTVPICSYAVKEKAIGRQSQNRG
uniref:Uncharacterized protein n=1 Tax=Rhizophora mucronata TaxID=61149 RepID=A0A2P2PRK1_RHIMU